MHFITVDIPLQSCHSHIESTGKVDTHSYCLDFEPLEADDAQFGSRSQICYSPELVDKVQLGDDGRPAIDGHDSSVSLA
jgi:hypothetical protein